MADRERDRGADGDEPVFVRLMAASPVGRDNRLVRAVAGAHANLRTKLLVAFLAIAALLVLVAVLGLRLLGQSNARVERLGSLQQRSSQYQTLFTQANLLRQLFALRSGGEPGFATLTHATSNPGPAGAGGRRQRHRPCPVGVQPVDQRRDLRLRAVAGGRAGAHPDPPGLRGAR